MADPSGRPTAASRTVYRVDPESGRILKSIRGVEANAIAVADGAAWVAEPRRDDIVHIDASGRVVARIRVPGDPIRIAADADRNLGCDPSPAGGRLARAQRRAEDRRENEETRRRRFGAGHGAPSHHRSRLRLGDERHLSGRAGVASRPRRPVKDRSADESRRRDDQAGIPARRCGGRERPRLGRGRATLTSERPAKPSRRLLACPHEPRSFSLVATHRPRLQAFCKHRASAAMSPYSA